MAYASQNNPQEDMTTTQRPDIVEDTNTFEPKPRASNKEQEWKGQYKAIHEDLLKDKLVQAIKYKDKKLLEKSIKDYNESRLPTENIKELEEAGRHLDIIRTKEALIEATKNRDVNDIQLLLRSVDENERETKQKKKSTNRASGKAKPWAPEDGYVFYLNFEMSEAKKVLRVIESGRAKNRNSVPTSLKMDRNTMSEIKRYTTPPDGLHAVMKASFLLLGVDEEITEDWSACAALSKPDGRQGLNRRVQTLDISSINPKICARAKQILEGIDYKKITKSSAGGATFYTWAMGTIEEYSVSTSLDGVEPADVETQKQILRPESLIPEEQPMFVPKTNKIRYKASVKPNEQFERDLRAPHSGGKAKDVLVEPKQYSKVDY